MEEKALKGAPMWVKRTLAYLFRGRPPYPMVAPGLFSQLRKRGIPVWCVGILFDFYVAYHVLYCVVFVVNVINSAEYGIEYTSWYFFTI